jgi:hypothetical protein
MEMDTAPNTEPGHDHESDIIGTAATRQTDNT